MTSHKVWAEIDPAALRGNYRALSAAIKATSPDCRMMCVVKADAYGHGIEICVEALIGEGCDFFAVSSIEEAIAVRNVCVSAGSHADILILGYTPASEAAVLAEYDLIQTVFSLDYARALSAQLAHSGLDLRVHIKFDTGMNRIGFPAHNAEETERSAHEIAAAASLPGIIAEGAFTHFARADEGSGAERTHIQAQRYISLLERARALGAPLGLCHVCNSAASLRFPEYHFDICRLGVLLYGAEPSDLFDFPIRPVMRLCTQISQVHTLRAGEELSYGGTFVAPADMKVATLPIGYADGFIRAYSGAKAVIYSKDGRCLGAAPVIGRICMDQCMVALGDIDTKTGDTAVLIGEPGQLDALAKLAGTINYECLCLISARVPRVIRERKNKDEKEQDQN